MNLLQGWACLHEKGLVGFQFQNLGFYGLGTEGREEKASFGPGDEYKYICIKICKKS